MVRMWKRTAALFIFLTGCMTCAVATQAENVFDASDFARSPAYWRVSDGARMTVAGGQWTMTLDDGVSSAIACRNDLPLQPGMEYVLSGEVRAPEGAGGRVYIEWIQDGNYIHTSTTGFLSGEWVPFQDQFAFPGANTAAPYLVIQAQDGDIEVRDLVVRKVPAGEVRALPAQGENVFDASDFTRSKAYWSLTDGARMTVADGQWTMTLNSGVDGGAATRSNLSLEPGMEYVLSGEICALDGAGGRVYIEWIHDGNYIHTSTIGFLSGEWVPFQDQFSFAGANTAAPYLVIGSQNGGIKVRNLTVRKVPVRESSADNGGSWQTNDRVSVEAGSSGQRVRIKSGSAWLRRVPISEPGRYVLRFSVAGEGDAGNASGYYGFETRIHPADESLILCRKTDDVLPHARQSKEVVFEVAQADTVVSVEWANYSAGVLVLEDVEIAPKPLLAEEVYRAIPDMPLYRNTIFASHPAPAIAGSLTTDANVAACRSELIDGEGRVLGSCDGAEFSFPADNLPAGKYELVSRWEFRDGSSYTGTTPITVLPPAKREVVVGEDRQIYVNGEPFFPVVFYQMLGTWEAREKYWTEAAASGVNTLLLEREVTIENLDLAQKCGLKLMVFLGNIGIAGIETEDLWREKLRQTLTPEFVNHPALLGYYLVDEPNWGGRILGQLLRSYELLREADPYHPIWINSAPRGDIQNQRDYSTAADIYGVDIYPVPSPDPHGDLPNKQLSVVGDYATHISEAVEWRKPNWMILQAFAWGVLNNYTPVYPTREQLRFMAYDALMNGGTAIVFWGQVYILDKKFYRDLLATTRELHDISGLWARSEKYWLDESTPELELMLLEAEAHPYLIALNRSAAPVTFSVGVPWQGQVPVRFEDRTVSCPGGVLSDTVPAFGVSIYSADDLPKALYEMPEFSGGGFADGPAAFDCDGAGWIWAEKTCDIPGSQVCLYREFTVDPDRPIAEAVLTIGADDYAEVVVNGMHLGAAGSCRWLKRFSVWARPSHNYIGVKALDGGGLPCGVIGALEIRYADGGTVVIPTDGTWKVLPEAPADWEAVRGDTLTEHAFVVSELHSGKWFNVWGDQLMIE